MQPRKSTAWHSSSSSNQRQPWTSSIRIEADATDKTVRQTSLPWTSKSKSWTVDRGAKLMGFSCFVNLFFGQDATRSRPVVVELWFPTGMYYLPSGSKDVQSSPAEGEAQPPPKCRRRSMVCSSPTRAPPWVLSPMRMLSRTQQMGATLLVRIRTRTPALLRTWLLNTAGNLPGGGGQKCLPTQQLCPVTKLFFVSARTEITDTTGIYPKACTIDTHIPKTKSPKCPTKYRNAGSQSKHSLRTSTRLTTNALCPQKHPSYRSSRRLIVQDRGIVARLRATAAAGWKDHYISNPRRQTLNPRRQTLGEPH